MPEGELVTLDYTTLLRWRNAKPHRTDKTSLKSATKLELHEFGDFTGICFLSCYAIHTCHVPTASPDLPAFAEHEHI